MINLRNLYGDKIFNRKMSYKNARYIPFVGSILLDLILAWVILRIFHVDWEFAFIKVYGLLFLFSILEFLFAAVIDGLNYRFTVKDAMAAEMKHYLSVFNQNVNWDEIATYDDFLLESAFNKSLSIDLRVLAGMNYGTVVDAMVLNPRFVDRLYELFCKIAPNYMGNENK